MVAFVSFFWGLVLGVLLGWFATWWHRRSLREQPLLTIERIVDRPIETPVDNPAHLARIRALEADIAAMAGLRKRVAELESDLAQAHNRPASAAGEPAHAHDVVLARSAYGASPNAVQGKTAGRRAGR